MKQEEIEGKKWGEREMSAFSAFLVANLSDARQNDLASNLS